MHSMIFAIFAIALILWVVAWWESNTQTVATSSFFDTNALGIITIACNGYDALPLVRSLRQKGDWQGEIIVGE